MCQWVLLSSVMCSSLRAADSERFRSTPESQPAQRTEYLVSEFGAMADGNTLDTEAIQHAIDAAGKKGGTVVLAPGRYRSGTLRLRSHVTLRLEPGAILLGSTDLADYPQTIPALRSYTDHYATQSLIYAENVENVGIVGRGTIDGQGEAFKSKTYKDRPYVIRMISCRNVLIDGIGLRHSAMWMQHYLACDDVVVRGIRVDNRCNANNDGIDIDGCRNVRVSDCSISSDDDALTLKSTSSRACENVTITNCVLSSRCNALKLGTETTGGFRQIAITNCVMYDTDLGGISLMIVDGGILDGVVVSNVIMRNVRVPFFIRLGDRARPPVEDMPRPAPGSVRNIAVSHVVATGSDVEGSFISGMPGHPIENVSLTDLRLSYRGGEKADASRRAIPELPEKYPDARMFGVLPAFGLYCRHVSGLRIDAADLSFEASDERPALVAEDVRNFDVSGLSGSCSTASSGFVWLHDVKSARLNSCVAPRGTTFVSISGQSERISLVGNDFAEAAQPYQLGHGLDSDMLFSAGNRMPGKGGDR